MLLTILSYLFSVNPDVTRPESAASGSSSEPQPSTSCQSPPPPQPLPTVSPILNANWAHEFVTPRSKMSRRNLMSYLERNVRPPPSARREMVRLIIDNLRAAMARRRWPSLPNGSWPNILLVCVVLCSLLSTINIQHNAKDHVPSTVRFKMYMIVEFPTTSEIAIIPIEWMVGKSKTHALWSPYDSGKARLDCINKE